MFNIGNSGRRAHKYSRNLVCILLTAGLCRAQDQSKPDLTQMSIEELSKVRVYAASKYMQNVADAPSSVTIITAEEIHDYGYRTLADILQSVRGFYVTYDRDYSFLGVRGFGRLGDWSSRVLLLVDGHRINNNITGQAMIGSEFPVDLDLIQRIEIVRGPSSSLYGADAFFAVINVITRKAPQLKGLELSFSPSSFGSYQGRASYGGQYKGADIVLSDTFYNSQGPTLFFPAFDGPATNFGITRNTDYEKYQHALFTVSYQGFTLQGLWSSRDKGVPTAYYGSAFNDSTTRNLDDQQYLDLSYQHTFGSKWELAARTSYDQASLDAPLGLGAQPSDLYTYRGRWWDSNVQLSRTLMERHKITFGTEITDNLEQDQSSFVPDGISTFVPSPYHSVVWALYGQDEFAITRKLSLEAGLRYDHYYTFGGTTNPRLGLIYHLTRSTTAKVLYGTAFRAPEPFEINPGFDPFYDPNFNLKPESIRTGEAIIDQGLGERFSISGSVFENRINNLITQTVNPNNGQVFYENADGDHSIGTEVELSGRLAGGLHGRASYSFARTISEITDQIPPNSPKSLVKLNLATPLLHQKLSAAIDGQYTSAVSTLAGSRLGGFSVLNATLTGHTLNNHLDISASIYNLLDKKYADPGRPEDIENAIQQDGRTFRIKLTYRLGGENTRAH